MILSTLILIIAAITFSASTAINPLTIGLLILFLALVLAVTFGLSISSWVALLIFLIYIGGILVIFAYFVAITPNQNLPIPLLVGMILTSLFALASISFSAELKSYVILRYTSQTNIIYELFSINVLIILALILLFTIVVVVKVSIHRKGPLRPFFKYV